MISLAKAGKAVTYVFLRGFTETDHVMSIATKIQTEKYANITVLSFQDLIRYFRNQNPWYRSLPSELGLLRFYIQKGKFQNMAHKKYQIISRIRFSTVEIYYLTLIPNFHFFLVTYFEFLSKEKPSNIFVDEAPLEISWLAHIKLLPMSTLFTMNQPLIVGIVKLVALYIISFPPCLIFSNCIESYYPIFSWLFILLGSIQWLIMSASEGSYSVSKTTDVLKSIADQLSDSSSFLWIALQSNYLHDYSFGSQIRECFKKKKLQTWAFGSTSADTYLPSELGPP